MSENCARVTEHWHTLLREAVESLPWRSSKVAWGWALGVPACTIIPGEYTRMFCLQACSEYKVLADRSALHNYS